MGQSSTYDSDLKEDSASEIGKSMTTLNVPDTVSISRFSGEINSDKKPKAETKADPTNPMESLFESMGNANTNAVLSEAFFVIPAGKKAGDSWVDSSSTKDQKSVKTYNIKSIDKNIATLNVKTTVENNVQTETQGMQITVNMTTKTDSEVITDIKTSLVSKKTSKADISGTLELMGQSMPVTGKSTIVSVYSY
jgi:hypothetical protein